MQIAANSRKSTPSKIGIAIAEMYKKLKTVPKLPNKEHQLLYNLIMSISIRLSNYENLLNSTYVLKYLQICKIKEKIQQTLTKQNHEP